ncbi:MAG: alanine--tRNA ligase-related protein, partial [Succinatimonas hippei]|nr:alanine--tRNA ligase-related protein [Succinatimonas hippei]
NSKKNSRFDVDYNKDIKVTEVTRFTGYDTLNSEATVTGIYKDGVAVDQVSTDEKAVLILDTTPFYGEMGGQVGDRGSIKCGENTEFIVEDTKRVGKTIIHIGRVELGEFSKGMKVTACVDPQTRRNIAAHHTATHLLDAALRQVLGNDVVQKGSYVGADRLHYDYSYGQPLTLNERQKIASLINSWIRQNDEVRTEIMDLDAAKKSGAIALFDEKYEDKVRVVSMGDESKELCGGTHASRTGDLGVFVLVSDESVASGIRRIEARVGQAAIDYLQGIVRMVVKTAKLMKADNLSIAEKAEALLAKGKAAEKENEALKAKVISYEAEKLCQNAVEIGGIKLVAAKLEGYDSKDLRTAAEDVISRLKSGVTLLGAVNDGKVSLTASVSKDLISRIKAGDLVREAAVFVGGKGGGRPDLAQAGGTKAEGLKEAIASASAFLKGRS